MNRLGLFLIPAELVRNIQDRRERKKTCFVFCFPEMHTVCQTNERLEMPKFKSVKPANNAIGCVLSIDVAQRQHVVFRQPLLLFGNMIVEVIDRVEE